MARIASRILSMASRKPMGPFKSSSSLIEQQGAAWCGNDDPLLLPGWLFAVKPGKIAGA
jgi:hypothetical protein